MRLGQQSFVPVNPLNAGVEAYTTLVTPGSPVPPGYISVAILADATARLTVPASEAGNFHLVPGSPVYPVAIQEPAFIKARKALTARVEKEAISVHQRGYSITDATSTRPLICTTSIAPCIGVVVYSPVTRMAALGHFDANMRWASVANMIDEFGPGVALDLYFHGGMTGMPQSQATCEGLLQGLYDKEGKQQRFTVKEFDVMARVHANDITFDSAAGTLYAGFAHGDTPFDSVFRTLTNGAYLANTATDMAHAAEAMTTSTDPAARDAGIKARDIRKQFDARPDKMPTFLKTVEQAVYAAVASTAVQRAGKGSVPAVNAAISGVLRPANVVELVETNLKRCLATTGASGDRKFLVECLVIDLLHGDDLAVTTTKWLASAR